MPITDHIVTEEESATTSANVCGIPALDLVDYPHQPGRRGQDPDDSGTPAPVLGIPLNDHETTVGITDPGDVLTLDDARATSLTFAAVLPTIRAPAQT